MKPKLILSLVLSVLLPKLTFAQDYPMLRDVQIHCAVDHHQGDSLYYYAFGLTNGITSEGKINELGIDISRDPRSLDSDTSGLRFENDGFIEASFRRHFPFLKGKIVQVGLLASPGTSLGFTWTGGFSNALTAGWTADFATIEPGQSVGGFVMVSKGLPGIRRCIVSPFFNFDRLFSRDRFPTDEDLPNTDSIQNAVKFYGWTVGPFALPMTFDNAVWIDTLTSEAAQSRSLGWITNQATADKYATYFALTKSQLQANNTASARTTLQAVLQDANVDSTSNLTSEAYALIRYNTEYLLAQLPAPPPPGLTVKLVNSAGTNLTGGSLQYYDGSWKDAVNNNDGTFHVNTTLATVSLRMTYEGGSQTKSNVTVGPDVVVFQTVNTQVMLQNSMGALIDTGMVQYYYSSWRTLGTTTNGVATKELLPATYTFRMTYATATNDKQQDIGANPTVVFTTVNGAVQLKNSLGGFIDQGTVQYYFSSWQAFGHTMNGVVSMELLPANYTFRMSYASATNDKQQNIGTNPTVVFQTVSAAVQLQNSQGALIDTGTVLYYFSSWQNFGTTTSGVATKELLPANYTFRISYASATKDKQQNIGTNPTVVFTTVNATVQLTNSLGAFIDQGTVQYYFNSWKTFGTTTNGVAAKELLPASYTFRMAYETVTNDKVQDISTNSTVSFSTVLCTVKVKNGQGQPVDGAQVSYYFSSWVPIGVTVGGQVTKELLPASLTFRETIGSATQNKMQNIGTNAQVEFVVQ